MDRLPSGQEPNLTSLHCEPDAQPCELPQYSLVFLPVCTRPRAIRLLPNQTLGSCDWSYLRLGGLQITSIPCLRDPCWCDTRRRRMYPILAFSPRTGYYRWG